MRPGRLHKPASGRTKLNRQTGNCVDALACVCVCATHLQRLSWRKLCSCHRWLLHSDNLRHHRRTPDTPSGPTGTRRETNLHACTHTHTHTHTHTQTRAYMSILLTGHYISPLSKRDLCFWFGKDKHRIEKLCLMYFSTILLHMCSFNFLQEIAKRGLASFSVLPHTNTNTNTPTQSCN